MRLPSRPLGLWAPRSSVYSFQRRRWPRHVPDFSGNGPPCPRARVGFLGPLMGGETGTTSWVLGVGVGVLLHPWQGCAGLGRSRLPSSALAGVQSPLSIPGDSTRLSPPAWALLWGQNFEQQRSFPPSLFVSRTLGWGLSHDPGGLVPEMLTASLIPSTPAAPGVCPPPPRPQNRRIPCT